MSFSGNVKAELCAVPLQRSCCAAAEAYGALLYANTFSAREIKLITASPDFARRLPKLFQKAFGFGFDFSGTLSRAVLSIRDADKIRTVYRRYGYDPDALLAHHINLGVLEEDCCRAAFFRGAFLAGGSVTDPSCRCHLELVTEHRSVSAEAYALLREMGFSPKDTVRAGRSMLYFKQSEAIEDFLTTVGAPGAAMGLMGAKIEKDMRNAINRKVNCDSANADKIVSAAQAQLEHIRAVGVDTLPEDLRSVALLRIANPEASLADLAALSDPPISKSGLSHRMRRLMSYPEERSR